MKKMMLILGGLLLLCGASAQPGSRYSDDDYYDDDLYRWGVEINNYAAPYADQFVISLAREYNFPRNDLRYYLRKGYSPSDLLAGIELSRRSGYPLRAVMDYYRGSRDRNWISVSLHFGIRSSSADFRFILGRFREYSRYWNSYYLHRHPGPVPPPVYRHGWSYFRPGASHHHPAPRPPHPAVRPPQRPRPQIPPAGNRPGISPGHNVRPERPSGTGRPQQPVRRPRTERPDDERSARNENDGNSYRRNSSQTTKSQGKENRGSNKKENSEKPSAGGYRR